LPRPTGSMDFDEHNQPRQGHMEAASKWIPRAGGKWRAADAWNRANATMEFTERANCAIPMERGVEMHSEQVSESANGPMRVEPDMEVAAGDVDFRDNGHGRPSRRRFMECKEWS